MSKDTLFETPGRHRATATAPPRQRHRDSATALCDRSKGVISRSVALGQGVVSIGFATARRYSPGMTAFRWLDPLLTDWGEHAHQLHELNGYPSCSVIEHWHSARPGTYGPRIPMIPNRLMNGPKAFRLLDPVIRELSEHPAHRNKMAAVAQKYAGAWLEWELCRALGTNSAGLRRLLYQGKDEIRRRVGPMRFQT